MLNCYFFIQKQQSIWACLFNFYVFIELYLGMSTKELPKDLCINNELASAQIIVKRNDYSSLLTQLNKMFTSVRVFLSYTHFLISCQL